MKKKIWLVFFLMIVVFIPSNQLEKQKEEIILASEVEREKVFEPTVFLNGGEFSGEITEDTLLHKGNYTVSKDLVIKEGVIVEVEAGSQFNFSTSNTIVSIQGKFKLSGTEADNINVEYSRNVGSKEFILVEKNGILEADFVNVHNKSSYYSGSVSPAITNNGRSLLNSIKVTTAGAVNGITSSGVLTLTNSIIDKNLMISDSGLALNIHDNIIKGNFNVDLTNANIQTFKDINNNVDNAGNLKLILLEQSPQGSIKLYKQIYQINNSIVILENETMEIEAGSTFKNQNSSQNIVINGTLILNGTEEQKVNIDYAMSENLSFFQIEETGTLKINYTEIYNRSQHYNGDKPKPVINNLGKVDINYLNLTSKSAYSHVESAGDTKIINSSLIHSLIIKDGSKSLVVQNNVLKGTFNVSLKNSNINTFKEIKNNTLADGTEKIITLLDTPMQDIKLYKQSYQVNDSLIIPENKIMEIEAGTTLKSENSLQNFIINGTLKLNGTEEEKVNIDFAMSEKLSFFQIEETGILEINHTNMHNRSQHYNGDKPKPVINNLGTIIIDYLNLTSNGARTSIRNDAIIQMTNSNLVHDLDIANGKSNVVIKDSVIKGEFKTNFSETNNNTFKQIINNTDVNGNAKPILLYGSPLVNVILYKNNIYEIVSAITIPENVVVEMEAGSILKNQNSSQNIIINGILKLIGTEEEKVNIDYAPSSSYSFLQIGELGRLEMVYTDMYNRATHSNYDHLKPAINNLGTMIIDHLNLTTKGAYSNIENNGNIKITNSYLIHNLVIQQNSSPIFIENNVIGGTFSVYLEACFLETFSNIKNNYTKDNQAITVKLEGQLLRSVKLSSSSYLFSSALTIPKNVELIIESGSNITFGLVSGFKVYGSMKLLGIEEKYINIKYDSYSTDFRFIDIMPNGNLEIIYTNIENISSDRDGRPKTYAIYNSGTMNAAYVNIMSKGVSHNIKNVGKIELINSKLCHSLFIEEGSIIDNIENNIFVTGVFTVFLEGCDLRTFDQIHTNYKNDGSIKDILLEGNLKRSVRLPKQVYTREKKLIIPEGLELIIEKGTTFQLESSIEVAGTLKLFGEEQEPVNVGFFATGDQSKVINILETGSMHANYATINNTVSFAMNGSRQIYAIYNNGILIASHLNVTTVKHSSIVKNLGQIDLLDSYIQDTLYIEPGSVIQRIENNIMSRFNLNLEGCNLENLQNILNNYDTDKNEIVINLYGSLVRSVRLPKHKYEMNSALVIPDNMQLIIDAGSVLNMKSPTIEVNGIMKVFGTGEENVIINYNRGTDAFITVGSNGKVEANYATLHNVDSWSAIHKTMDAINNQGNLTLQNSQLLSDYASCNVKNSGSLNIKNSHFDSMIHLNDGSHDININDSVLGSSIVINTELKGSVSINRNASTSYQENAIHIPFQYITPNLLENMKDNYNSKDNLYSGIGLTGNVTKSVKLPGQKYMLRNIVEIDENSVLEVEPGALLKTKFSGIQVIVNGVLNLRGSLDNPIKFSDLHEGTSEDNNWKGIVINPSGMAIVSNTEFVRVGYGSGTYAIENAGQLIMWNSILDVARGNGIRYNTTNTNQVLVNNFIKGTVGSYQIPINATFNYWNSENGPRRYNPDTNSYVGDGVTILTNNIQIYPYNTFFVKNDIESVEYIKTVVYDAPHFGKLGVNSFNGNYSKQYVDFEVSNNLNIIRTYNSKNTKESILGYGWSLSYDSYVEKHPYGDHSYLVHLPDSSINVFMKQDEQYVSLNSRNTFQIVNEKYVLTTKEQMIYTYGKNGKLESITDQYGNKTVLTYTNHLLTSITDSNHRTYTLEYQNDLLTKVTDPMNRTTEYRYKDNLLSKVINTNGIETIYSYNAFKQLVNVKENNNVMLTLEYITEGIYKNYILKLTNEKGLTKTYTYDSSSNMTIETDSNNRITKKYYDRDGYVYKEINPNENAKTTTYQLENGTNKYGEVASITDINSAKTTYARDEKGNIIKVTNPDSGIKQYTYNSKNQVTKEIDEVGSITEYIYDTDEITLLKQVKPLDGKTIYSEEADQSKFQIISYTYYEPSEVNNIKGLIKIKTDEKGTTTYTYNDNGDIISIMNANNIETVYTKNKLGWTLTEQVEDGYLTEYEYDNRGNVTSIRKDSKLISKTEYNYQNKPIKVMDGNCKEITLITNVTKSLNWNSNQSLLSTSDNSMICDAITYEYDISGNKIKETDREGNITTYQYDQYGNVIRKNLPNDSSYFYEYDTLNRLVKTSFEEEEETTLLEEKTYTLGSTSTVTTKTYTNDTDFKTMVESYNNRGFKTIEKLETHSATTNYYKNGQVSSTVDRNGAYTYYYYDKVNQLSKKCVQANSYYICTLYTYDHLGRLIEEKVGKNTVSSSGTPSSYVITTYEYDDLGQVIKKTTSSGEEIEYTYDIYGNVLTQKIKISEDKYQTKTYEYNDLNKVTKENLEGIITTYEYDGVGNLLKKITGENVVTEYQYNKNYQITKTILDNITQEMISYDNMGNVIEKTDPNGNVTKYSYDKRNNVIKETSSKNFITTHSYDFNNRLIKTKEQNKTIVYSYDKFDNVISKTINDTITYQYTYDKNNNVLKEIDPLGHSVTYVYDKLNRVVQVTDKLGNYKTYGYDTLSNIVTERNEKSIYTYSIYDERGNVKEKKVGSLVIEQNEYDLMNNLTKKKDANNNVTTYEYNTLNQLVKKTNPLGYIEEYEYDKNGNVVKIKTSDKVILYSYDNRGNLLKTVEESTDGKQKIETSKEYDNSNNVIKEIDGNGNITIHTYDSLNNLIKTKNPLNQETIYEYDNNNNLVKETNYLGDSKVYIYDSFDRVIEKKNELNETIEKLEYDLNGRQIKSIDGLGHTTTFVYDKLDRVIEKIDPLNRSEKTTYDALGNVLTKTDPNGNITRYEYNNFNKVTKITNPLNEVTIYTYDNNNNLLTVTDGNSKRTIYTYNALNLELTEKDSLGNIETKEYNSNGTLKKKTTKNGSEIFYSYDIHDRLIKENDIVYKYDNNNNLLEIKENENVITRTYDKLNRVVSKTENGFTTTLTYSDYTETSIDPKGNETIKKFDKTGRLKEVVGNASYIYNLDGTVSKVTYQNGSIEEYTYKDDKSLDTLVNTYGDNKETYQYQYDNNKNIISKYENGKETSYTYDALNRLKTISEVIYQEIGNEELERVETLLTTYIYDKAGNRIKEVSGTVTKEYTYDSNNRLIKIIEKEDNIVTKTTDYTYDKNGNSITETVNKEVKVTNTYNERNELIKTVSDKEINYIYNPEGKRIQKQVDNKVIKYIYEGLDVILELDENDNKIAQNIYGLSLISRNTDQKGYYLYNGHGDTVRIVDNEENLLNSYTYDEWGVIIDSNGEFDNPYRYAGYYYDIETDNYYLISRYYNPEIARFISEDSYRGDYNDPLSLNRYVYVVNNPLIYIDPDGYWPKWLEEFGKNLWDETVNFGKTLGATFHGGAEAIVDTLVGIVQNPINAVKQAYYGGKYIDNELYHAIGLKADESYKADAKKYGTNFMEIASQYNVINMATGIFNNFKTTLDPKNLESFVDKDTPYSEKVAYANSATKTAMTVYGTYKVGQGIYNKVTQVNTAGTLKTYGNNNLSNTTLYRNSPYSGQKTYLVDYNKIINQYNWGNPETLYDHFDRHGKKLDTTTPEQYADSARKLYDERYKYEVKQDVNGIVRVYDYDSKLLGSYNIDGTTRTFLKARSHNYWYNQPGKIINRGDIK